MITGWLGCSISGSQEDTAKYIHYIAPSAEVNVGETVGVSCYQYCKGSVGVSGNEGN